MNQLVFIEDGRPVTDSLIVAETFGKEHRRVMQDIRELDCSKEFNQHNFVQVDYLDSRNRAYPKYLITQDGFAFLVMGYTGKEAARFKELYIGEFNRMRDELVAPSVPRTLPEALRFAADLADKNLQLQLEGAQKDQIINELKPKASYVDQILKSKNTVTVSQIAKDYGLTAQELNKILHDEGVQYKVKDQWLLYCKHQDQGYTRSQTIDVHHNDGSHSVKMHTQWTQKGRLLIHEILKQRGIIPYLDRESA